MLADGGIQDDDALGDNNYHPHEGIPAEGSVQQGDVVRLYDGVPTEDCVHQDSELLYGRHILGHAVQEVCCLAQPTMVTMWRIQTANMRADDGHGMAQANVQHSHASRSRGIYGLRQVPVDDDHVIVIVVMEDDHHEQASDGETYCTRAASMRVPMMATAWRKSTATTTCTQASTTCAAALAGLLCVVYSFLINILACNSPACSQKK